MHFVVNRLLSCVMIDDLPGATMSAKKSNRRRLMHTHVKYRHQYIETRSARRGRSGETIVMTTKFKTPNAARCEGVHQSDLKVAVALSA